MERIKHALEKNRQQHASQPQPAAPRTPPSHSGLQAPSGSPHELEQITYTQTRVVKLDEAHLRKNRIIALDKRDPMSVNFDLLRTLVLQKMEEKGWRTLAITSPTPESGKSVIAINLAMSIAQQLNKSAILADFDLRRPKVAGYLGLHLEKSLNDLLEGNAELPEILLNPDIPRLVVLPTRNPIRNSSEMLSSRKISELIADLRERYDSRIILFDLPPLLATDDTIALLPQVDCILLVVANGGSTQQEIEHSMRLIPAEHLLGTVLNKADIVPTSYYY